MKLVAGFFHYLKKFLRVIISRPVIVALLLLLQVGIMFVLPTLFISVNKQIDIIFRIISIFAVFWIVSKDENPYFKISWICLFFFFPIVGVLIYFIMSRRPIPKKIKLYIKSCICEIKNWIPPALITQPKLEDNLLQSKYINVTSGYPVVANTAVEYYSLGDYMFEAIIDDLNKAQKYIFLEFFIISQGMVMDRVLEVLKSKIAQGVKVYFMYDDIGSLAKVPSSYVNFLRSLGINACIFNPFRLRINPVLNYRDHRKIIVVDGNVAYCGGMNLSDEYVNKKSRFGHWKDTGVRLHGDGALPFILMFVQQWQFVTSEELKISDFMPDFEKISNSCGFVQSYGDDPLAKYNIAENAYLNAIWQAKDYIYITTPYLVIDNAMEGALCAAATRGVDVRIITPYIYDKWYVHMVTRSNYLKLISNGVKIYEYTPGFIHSKMFVSDDAISMVGTSNMDFRSFYHHFECSVLIYENDKNKDIKSDILDCVEKSHLITYCEMKNQPIHLKLGQSVLRLFAPLL